MRRTPIDWQAVLDQYPGRDNGERFREMIRGKTYRALARELQMPESTVKAFVLRFDGGWPGRKKREYVVSKRARADYAALFRDAVRTLAQEAGLAEPQYRKRMETEAGELEFKKGCARLKVPLFECRYRGRRRGTRR